MSELARLIAASILVGAGLATYKELGVERLTCRGHLHSTYEARGRGLKYRPEVRDEVIAECKCTLGLA